MNPLDALLEAMGETAVRRAYAPGVVTALQSLIRDLMGLPMFAPLVTMLQRDSPGSETLWRFAANWIRPSRALRGRPLPGGVTPRIMDEMWEEAVLGARAAVMAAPPAPPAAPGAPYRAPSPPPAAPAEPGAWDRLKEWAEIRLVTVPIVLSVIWAYLAVIFLTLFSVFSAFILRAEKLSMGRLHWFHPWVVAEGKPWLKCAKLITAILIVVVVLTLLRAILSAARDRFVDRRWLVVPVIIAYFAVPVSSLALATALDVTILLARVTDHPIHFVLPLLEKADRYAMWFAIPSLMNLAIVTGLLFVLDKFADAPAKIAQRFGVGSGNIPFEIVYRGFWGIGLSVLAGCSLFHLAATRWPSAQQVMDFLYYGLALVVLSGIILAWAGVQSNPRVRKWMGIAFVAVFTVTTLYVWYKIRHPGVLGAAADQGVEVVLAHRPWYEQAWHYIVRAWHFVTGAWTEAQVIVGAVVVLLFAFAMKQATGGAKGIVRALWILSLVVLLPLTLTIGGTLLVKLLAWTPPWRDPSWHLLPW